MIFRDHKLIFIHIPKTGGSSIERSICAQSGVTVGWRESGEGFYNKHLDLQRAEIMWSKCFNDPEYRIFTVVRNPYTLVASQYIQTIISRSHRKNIANPGILPAIRDGFRAWVKSGPKTLLPTSEEVDVYLPDLPGLLDTSAGESQFRFLQSADLQTTRRIECLRFETLSHDYDQLMGPACLYLQHHIGNRNLPGGFYKEMYDEEAAGIVYDRLKVDFMAFRYHKSL